MVAITTLAVGGAIANADVFYGVETPGSGGVQKTGEQIAELSLDTVAGASLGSGLVADPVHNDGADTLTFSLEDIAEAQLLGRADGAGTGAPTVITPAQARTIINIIETSAGAPATTPDFEGQLNIDTTNDAIYAAVAAAASTDWKQLPAIEVGSWNPTATFVTPGDLSDVYSTQEGEYFKIGEWVIVSGRIVTSTFTYTTASGNFLMGGLPFDIKTTGILFQGGGVITTIGNTFTWPTGTTQPSVAFVRGQAGAQLRAQGTGAASVAFSTASIASGSVVSLSIFGVYRAD